MPRKRVSGCWWWNSRRHVGINAFDRHDDTGILVHPYGLHIFHTTSADIFRHLSPFTRWRPYEHRVRAGADGRLVAIPINLGPVNALYGLNLTGQQLEQFFELVAEKVAQPRTSEDVVVDKVGRELHNKFFGGYTRKQWGLDPSELDASVTARMPTRTNRDDRYSTDTYQAMPERGCTRMFEATLAHPRICVMLGTDYRDIVHLVPWKHLVYTVPVDAFFDHRFGRLPDRSLDFEHVTRQLPPGQSRLLPAGTINHPNDSDYTCFTEFKHLTGRQHAATSLVYDYPRADGDPYCPVPRPESTALYRRYETETEQWSDVSFVGRLATYKHHNMDQAVRQVLALAKRLLDPCAV